MRWTRNVSAGWLRSVNWVCLSLALGLWLTAPTAHSQEPSPERPSVVVAQDSLTVTLSRTDLLLLLDDIAYLEADLADCNSRLQWAEQEPPECSDGPGWVKLGLAVALGVVAGLAL